MCPMRLDVGDQRDNLRQTALGNRLWYRSYKFRKSPILPSQGAQTKPNNLRALSSVNLICIYKNEK
jgi:hypothetical protein